MLATGKNFESIVEMLNRFRSEVQAFASLGLLNINKHSENFIKTLLNLTYGYELENLNKGKANFPGLDLGDSGEGIAFQITSTKKTEKVDDALTTCLNYKHYETFKNINIFILTKKQSTYSIKTTTEPHFSFSAEENIWDFDDLMKDIEHVGQSRMKVIHDYLQKETQPTIDSIRDDKVEERKLLDTEAALKKTGMTTYALWQSSVRLKNQNLSVPDLYTKLNEFLPTAAIRNIYLPILNPAVIKRQSGKEVLYLNEITGTGVANWFHGYAMLIEPSSLTVEVATYSNHEIQMNLLSEMVMMLTKILFFSKYSRAGYEIDVKISLNSNTVIYFSPQRSLVIEKLFNSFTLDGSLEVTEKITNVETSNLADLLQKIMHGFIAHEPTFLSNVPFLTIDRLATEIVINNIKSALGIGI